MEKVQKVLILRLPRPQINSGFLPTDGKEEAVLFHVPSLTQGSSPVAHEIVKAQRNNDMSIHWLFTVSHAKKNIYIFILYMISFRILSLSLHVLSLRN